MNGLTHFFGIVMGIIALGLLLNRTTPIVTPTHKLAFIIYGISMILLFTFSTLYHWLPLEGKKLEVFRKIDHIMIFVFIAASYTPLSLTILKGTLGNVMIITVWTITIAGFFMKLFWLNAPRYLYTAIYLLMGWVFVFAFYPLFSALSFEGIM